MKSQPLLKNLNRCLKHWRKQVFKKTTVSIFLRFEAPQMSLEQSAQYHHRLAEKWEVLVAGRVRGTFLDLKISAT